MKRYRIFNIDFDSRVRSLDPIDESWEESVKVLHKANRESTVDHLRKQYGECHLEQKVQNFIDLKAKSFSVIAFHNHLYEQARSAFVSCHYYPALTSVVALGERVLNHLILGLREEFKMSASYKKVFKKNSFDNWKVPIDALTEWAVLTTDAEAHFRSLWIQRNYALHFNADVEYDARAYALKALDTFGEIIEAQFSGFGQHPCLFTPPGEVYIRKEWEDTPFIRLVYIPNAMKVGHKHKVISVFPWQIEDTANYDEAEITDEQFTELRAHYQNAV